MECPFCGEPDISKGYHRCPALSTKYNAIIFCPMDDGVAAELAAQYATRGLKRGTNRATFTDTDTNRNF